MAEPVGCVKYEVSPHNRAEFRLNERSQRNGVLPPPSCYELNWFGSLFAVTSQSRQPLGTVRLTTYNRQNLHGHIPNQFLD